VVLPVGRELLERAEQLAAIGYDHQPGSFPDDPDHLFFRKVVEGRRRAHLHALSSTSPKPVEYRLFRQFLTAHPEAASKYATDKLRLAERVGYDRSAYVAAKERVVEELMKDARSWQGARDSGLPPGRS
jgi:GrpB-like predicted nucleotidyltransferase (UPF0157 family)